MTSNPPRILVLLTAHFPAKKGDASFVGQEIDALSKAFDEILIFSSAKPEGDLESLPGNVRYVGTLNRPGHKAELKRLGVRTLQLLPPLYKAWLQERRFAKDHDRRRNWKQDLKIGFKRAIVLFDVIPKNANVTVYSFWGYANGLCLPFLPGNFRKVIRFHGGDLYEYRVGELPLRAAILQSADAVVPISADGAKYLLSAFSEVITSEKVKVVRLGTLDQGVGPTPKPDSEDNEWVVASCSAVSEVKRVAKLLPALESIANSRRVRWVHFGDGPLMEELQDQVADACKRTPSFTAQLRGHVPHSEVTEFYRQVPVHAFANVSSSEGLPVSIMEAMSFGVPVVATDVGGTADLVGEELESGLLIDSEFATSELAEKIASVCMKRDKWRPRQTWSKLCNAEVQCEKIVEVLTK